MLFWCVVSICPLDFRKNDAAGRPKREFVPKTLSDLGVLDSPHDSTMLNTANANTISGTIYTPSYVTIVYQFYTISGSNCISSQVLFLHHLSFHLFTISSTIVNYLSSIIRCNSRFVPPTIHCLLIRCLFNTHSLLPQCTSYHKNI